MKETYKTTNASSKIAKAAITECNEGMQNQSNKLIAKIEEIISNSETKMHFSFQFFKWDAIESTNEIFDLLTFIEANR